MKKMNIVKLLLLAPAFSLLVQRLAAQEDSVEGGEQP